MSDLVRILHAVHARGQPVHLTLAGDGPDKPAFLDSLRSHGLLDHVTDLGDVAATDLRERVYRRIDVLLVTSTWETGPIVAWEAMVEGAALLTSDYLDRKAEGSLADGENCRVFPVGDPERAATLLASLADEAERSRLADAGRALVLRRYTREASVRQWHDALRHVMELPLPARSCALPPVPKCGRLDRLMGVEYAEKVRRALGRRSDHRSPGAEWPHSHSSRTAADPDFWTVLRALDRSPPGSAGQRAGGGLSSYRTK